MDVSRKVSRKRLSQLLDLSERNLAQKIADGDIPSDGTAIEQLHAYIRRLRAVAAGRSGETQGDLDLTEERAKLARAQTEKIDMELAIRRAELIPAENVTAALSSVAAQAAAILDSVPVKLKRESPHLSASDIDIVKRELAKARNLMAGIEHESVIKGD